MNPWRVKVLYDGACPLCRREADLWRWLDRGRGRVALEDVSSPDFDTTKYGLTHEQAMGQIHGILPSGAVVRGMEVFRRAYAAVGWQSAAKRAVASAPRGGRRIPRRFRHSTSANGGPTLLLQRTVGAGCSRQRPGRCCVPCSTAAIAGSRETG